MPQLCGAKTRAGTPCRRPPMANGRCDKHGGKTPRGFALPQTRHGRYSKDLPTRLAARYEEALTDPDLLNLRAEIALLDARRAELLRRLDTGESGELWEALTELHAVMERQHQDGELEPLGRSIERLGALIARAMADEAAWREIRALVDQRRKLVAVESRRLMDMQQTITSEKAMVLLAAVADTVKRHVRDRDVLARIAADLGRLVDSGAG